MHNEHFLITVCGQILSYFSSFYVAFYSFEDNHNKLSARSTDASIYYFASLPWKKAWIQAYK